MKWVYPLDKASEESSVMNPIKKELRLLCKSTFGYLSGYPALTGNPGLAQAAAVPFDPEHLLHVAGASTSGMGPAFHLVMPLFGDCTHRTALCAGHTTPVVEIKAVIAVVLIRAGGRGHNQPHDHRPRPMGLSLGRNQAVTQSEGPQSAGVGGVTLGPAGGPPV